MIRINLLPAEIHVAEVRKQFKFFGIILGAVVGLLMVTFLGMKINESHKVEKKLAQANDELKRYQTIVDRVNQLEVTRNQLKAQSDVIHELLKGPLLYPKFFEDFMALLPAEVWVSNLATTWEGQGTLMVRITAQSLSNFAIADWLTSLQGSPLCRDVVMGSITTQEGSDDTKPAILAFSLTFRYLRSDI